MLLAGARSGGSENDPLFSSVCIFMGLEKGPAVFLNLAAYRRRKPALRKYRHLVVGS